MKTTIGGDRLGSGNKQTLSMRNYERSTHDLSYLWRSTMSSGTLVPFISQLGLPGDTFDIELNCEVLTLPTIGPLFGSYKVQLDVFEVPMRLYNAKLHMNKLGIGMDMKSIYLPQIDIFTNNHPSYVQTFDPNEHTHPSSLVRYLGITGLGTITGTANPAKREFNAVPFLAYYDIYKNYYSNKQQEIGVIIHTDEQIVSQDQEILTAELWSSTGVYKANLLTTATQPVQSDYIIIQYGPKAVEPDPKQMPIELAGSPSTLQGIASNYTWKDNNKFLQVDGLFSQTTQVTVKIIDTPSPPKDASNNFGLVTFPLENIDKMREKILQFAGAGPFVIDNTADMPYSCNQVAIGENQYTKYAVQMNQEGLAIKTYQSDLFNNWISTEWIEGENGVNALTAVDTSSGEFTIDALNIASKVYNMLNRIAISGGTYDDWLDAVYTHERVKGVESPVYCGSLIKQLGFEEVVSLTDTTMPDGNTAPLGTLAGKGRLSGKHKGGKIVVKVSEPSYIIGIVSITPMVDYSQGNNWDINLKTYDDFHKPALDAIGFQDLVAEQMLASDSSYDSNSRIITYHSVGKQPAWLNYMTAVNKCYGNFADANKEMFMTLNRRYEADTDGTIKDATTYIDPTKFNQIFAETNLDSQNFWVQISVNNIARRKMSAKVIPNL